MTEKAGRLIYQAGNRSSRGRLAPDLTARPNYYPRCLIISTGKCSYQARDRAPRPVTWESNLTRKRPRLTRPGLRRPKGKRTFTRRAMAAYLEDLAPRLEDYPGRNPDLWEGYRTAFQSAAHLRIPEIQAWLAVGFEMFLRFQIRMGAISQDQGYEMLNRAWKVFRSPGGETFPDH